MTRSTARASCSSAQAPKNSQKPTALELRSFKGNHCNGGISMHFPHNSDMAMENTLFIGFTGDFPIEAPHF